MLYIYMELRVKPEILTSYIQDDSGGICVTLGNDSMCDSKQNVHRNMGPNLNGYRDYGKKKIRTILRARTAVRNKSHIT
jgi:hypothetical protein